ncbi:S8 family serine peptidase [Sorangium sp. So ce1024]|uniref:S8 family serine peptidase n=1 Tax=Sorangium sp. So ce1024 TaxID=3133327 RepID=UPI003F031DC9
MTDISTPRNEQRTTGRKLVVLSPTVNIAVMTSALEAVGMDVVVASQYGGAVPPEKMDTADAIVFDRLQMMVVADTSPAALAVMDELMKRGVILSVEDEGYVYAIGAPALHPSQREYLDGYRAGVNGLIDHLLTGGARAATQGYTSEGCARGERPSGVREGRPGHELHEPGTRPLDQGNMTWGLNAIGIEKSPYTGRGIRVAILDTGLDSNHPDFRGRKIVSQSFVPRETAQDVAGHGTHTAGTACGPQSGARGPRYGVAYEAELFIGKVLGGPQGSGQDGWIMNGINWALSNGCRVISMSLGSEAPPSNWYRMLGERALRENAILVAAAGNASQRSRGYIARTGSPANVETILAVAALDSNLRVADFSSGGKIDIAGPGVDVYSSWPLPSGYNTISGTSMATPHVAGVIALMMQADPHASARQIWQRLQASARRLNLAATDVGAGLVQAPVSARTEPEEPIGKQSASAPTSPSAPGQDSLVESGRGQPPSAREPSTR